VGAPGARARGSAGAVRRCGVRPLWLCKSFSNNDLDRAPRRARRNLFQQHMRTEH
jgi:hypothetical protein